MRQSDAGAPPPMARSRRGSLTPRIGSLGEAMQERSKKATSRAALSYNARSWSLTLKMLDIRHEQAFVLYPWLLFTAWAAALVTSRHLSDDVRLWLADGVPASATGGLATTMSMLLAFRLQASYSRWSDARSLWGQVVLGTRSLLSQLIAIAAVQRLQPSSHAAHAQVGGWCIGFAVSLKQHLRQVPLPFQPIALPDTRSVRRSTRANQLELSGGEYDGLYKLLSAR